MHWQKGPRMVLSALVLPFMHQSSPLMQFATCGSITNNHPSSHPHFFRSHLNPISQMKVNRLLDGTTRNLLVSSPSVAVFEVKNRIREISGIPIHNQHLISGNRALDDDSILQAYEDSNDFPTCHLVLRLPGGKGGFGSLLRGAATKAGQKKTSNFDACRDMSGRRLRHVNAEKKLEEWKADAEQRKLEKVAEDYIKKNTKAVKKVGGSGGTEKYVEKYRQDSAKCMEKVDKSVRESLLSSKRKIGGDRISKSDAKRVKIWMGKRKMGDSESEDSEDDDSDREEEVVKSVVLNDEINSDSNQEIDGSSVSVTGGELTDGPSSGSNSDEEKRSVSLNQSEDRSDEQVLSKTESQVVHGEVTVVLGDATISRIEAVDTEKMELGKDEPSFAGKVADQPPNILSSMNEKAFECKTVEAASSSPLAIKESTSLSNDALDIKPLNLNEYNSASELEVFGLERLKSELQASGLKCGGTLQERASRLFLLKTTPLEKLPKKLLAKN